MSFSDWNKMNETQLGSFAKKYKRMPPNKVMEKLVRIAGYRICDEAQNSPYQCKICKNKFKENCVIDLLVELYLRLEEEKQIEEKNF